MLIRTKFCIRRLDCHPTRESKLDILNRYHTKVRYFVSSDLQSALVDEKNKRKSKANWIFEIGQVFVSRLDSLHTREY